MSHIPVCAVLAGCLFNLVLSMGGNMIENGIWEVKAIKECENPEKYDNKVDVEMRKLNRTHDCFNAWLNFQDPMDENFGIKIKICKWVDGGCKDYSVISDENIVDFTMKVAEENTRSAIKMMGVDSGDFPITPGEYEVAEYLVDYCEFPCKSVVGLFDAELILLDKDSNEKACLIATVDFREPEGDEQLCDKCQED